jgi:hypothetical protein
MSNPVFYACDLASAVFTMSLTEDSSYPLANLSSYLASKLWKSSANTNGQTLNIDLGSAKECDFVGMGAQNFSGMTVSLQYDDTDNPYFSSPRTAATLSGFANTPKTINFETSITKRYWRILFTSTNSTIPQLGLLFIGLKLSLPHTYDWDFNIGDKEYATTGRRAIDKTLRTVRLGGGVGKHQFKISLTDDTFRTNWQAMLAKTYGAANPIFWADHADNIRISHFGADYLPVSGHRYNITNIQETITLIDQSSS